jgi:hypothetical protein
MVIPGALPGNATASTARTGHSQANLKFEGIYAPCSGFFFWPTSR